MILQAGPVAFRRCLSGAAPRTVSTLPTGQSARSAGVADEVLGCWSWRFGYSPGGQIRIKEGKNVEDEDWKIQTSEKELGSDFRYNSKNFSEDST